MFRVFLIVLAFLMVASELAPYYVTHRSIDGLFIIGVEVSYPSEGKAGG